MGVVVSPNRDRVGLAFLLGILGLALVGGVASANPFGNVRNVPFASVANGPQGAIVVPARAGEVGTAAARTAAVRSAIWSQHSVASLRPAQATVDRMRQHGLVGATAQVRVPRTVVHAAGNSLVLPDLEAAIVNGAQIGASANKLEFEFEGFSIQDEDALRDYLSRAVPKARLLYGPPAFNITVKIIRDEDLQTIQGGTYDVTTNEIRIPPLSGNFPEDTYVLIMLVLHAFHDDAALFYDAWEQGMTGAVAYAVQTTPGVSPSYDPIDPGPFYCLSVYEAENQPELANPTYYPASGVTNMMVWRIAMARAAWLKCWIEDEEFFAAFNRQYYDNFTEQLAGDVPALKLLAATVLPQVEGESFFDWFEHQYVLDTSSHLGPKLYTWNIPLEISVALIVELYTTLSGGDEQPMGATARTTYWSYDFSVKLYAEEGNIIDIPGTGASAGEGFLLPTFFNIGGPQRVSVDIEAVNMHRRYIYPYSERGFESGENNLYGGIIGNAEGTIDVTGGDGLSSLEVSRGVWGDRITTTALRPMQLEIRFENKLGQTVTRTYNVGWDSYVTFIEGGEQTRVTHTFLQGETGLQLMSLPVQPLVNSAPDILGIAADRLLLAAWDPTLEGEDKYTIWPDTAPFEPGRGFWLKIFGDVSMQTFGLLPAEDEPARVYLPIGWNIIGSPRREPIGIEGIKVQLGEADPVSLSEAVDNGWVQQGIFSYDQQAGYDTVETLDPFAGYWFRILRSPGVYVHFPIAGAVGGENLAAENARQSGYEGRKLSWKLPLVASAGRLRSAAAYLGVAREAGDGADAAFDLAAPPDFGPYVKVRFVQPGDSSRDAAYLTDVRGENGTKRWELALSSSLPETEVRLSWPDLSELPAAVRPVLVDRDTGTRQYMRTSTQFAFCTDATGGSRNLAIELDTNSAAALVIGSVQTAQANEGVAVTYSLSKSAAVDMRVLNIAGRTVGIVCSDQVAPAGTSTTVWNMRNTTGRLVPDGMYLLQLTARDDEGRQIGVLRAMQLQR
jgi:hypothetical protein